MANKYHQISLKDTFSDCAGLFTNDAPSFFRLLEEHFDIHQFIPQAFFNAFYQHLGRNRDYPLTGFLSALILQKNFPIHTDSLLIILLKFCKELRDFCGVTKALDAPLFTRFKQNFADYIELMFQQMVDFTEPICQQINSSLAMKYRGVTKEKRCSDHIKWICPKVHMIKGKWICNCDNPCTSAKKGRTTYTYENLDFRMFPGIQRDSNEWISLYKIRTIVE